MFGSGSCGKGLIVSCGARVVAWTATLGEPSSVAFKSPLSLRAYTCQSQIRLLELGAPPDDGVLVPVDDVLSGKEAA